MCRNNVLERFIFFMLQFVRFARSYNITPSVLISANHSTTASGNLAPVHNGITTWIEIKHSALLLSTNNEIKAFLGEILPLKEKFIVTYLLFGVSFGGYHRVVTEADGNYFSFLFLSHFQFIKCCDTSKRSLFRKFYSR